MDGTRMRYGIRLHDDGPVRVVALGLLKRALVDPPTDLSAALSHEVSMQAQLMDADDYSEGLKAFADKRKPAFTGR